MVAHFTAKLQRDSAMQNFDLRNRSQCPIEAADNALRLLQLLREGGKLRLKDAAAELGFAPSTAHHLLAMLVYRGFVVKDEFKNYVPSVAIGVGPARLGWSLKLRDLARPPHGTPCRPPRQPFQRPGRSRHRQPIENPRLGSRPRHYHEHPQPPAWI